MFSQTFTRRFFIGLVAAFSTIKLWASEIFSTTRLERFCFGSCNKQKKSQSYWNTISQQDPQLWLWLGDNIYANDYSVAERAAEYAKQNSSPEYAAFKAGRVINGIWDDHDYHTNNSNGSYSQKVQSQKLALDFLEVPATSLRRNQEGLYYSYTYGTGDQQVEFIMLDTRYFKGMDSNFPMIGKTQFDWFTATLANSNASLVFVLTGVHLTTETAGGLFQPEGWNEHPQDRQRMLNTIDQSGKNVIILSGDRHKHDFTELPLASGKRLVEFMSSGLTHYSSNSVANRYRVGPEIMQTGFGRVDLRWSESSVTVDMAILSTDNGRILHSLSRSYEI